MKNQADKIILESLDYYSEDKKWKQILRYLFIGILVALGGMFFAAIMDAIFNGPENLSIGIGMYLCIVVVTCTGIVVTHMHKD